MDPKIFGSDVEIYVFEDFLTPNQLEQLDAWLDRANIESLWVGEAFSKQDTGTWSGRNLFIDNFELSNQIYQKVIDVYTQNIRNIPNTAVSFPGLGPINRTMEGQGLPVHDDLGPPELGAKTSHGIVIYLNDNFSGGELYYPDLGYTLSPKRGMMVVHPASSDYKHGVASVLSGIRYGITGFIYDPE